METDLELLNAARQMNKDALVKVFDLYSSALYKYAVRICGDRVMADHIVGDVFAKLLDQLSMGRGPMTNLRSYLYETVYHRILDEARYARHRVPLEVTDWLRQDANSASLRVEDKLLFQQILHILQNELTDDQRHVIILRFLEAFSIRETATILRKKEDHVRVIQGRAIAKLRQAFEYSKIKTAMSSPRTGNHPEP
jgi:RNA polymerase sigma-70 factor (ECF subfamily)